ncbi:hypothetical protein J4N45_14570 [Vibrio sp. SCSIO 43140]|uniref:hypothetical protein n=1 Tax=Vibrio sp. SCSIO 43140 TaxID=2819100 RepID=UPI002075863D|nr:hypothetical protein [Vibrio sp. SCSIO 43140]USD58788.1 hypothetical protein J4N45_09615 [Vibrio sp. SCSIO 43140]USD59122.1 hypothetical protein J4N45_11320 [Vibrio sp. SCSIO 43140]USD59725.1 hypothetical protein J4N45_14570 [Vibrio sp. SCSIO 43140]
MKKDDLIDFFFNDSSREILFNLVDKKQQKGLATGSDDVFEPTISAVFILFDELMKKNTPDLYESEWLLIAEAFVSKSTPYRLTSSLAYMRRELVISLEDLGDGELFQINSFELSKKIAGFSDIEISAVYYQVHQYLVAKKHNRAYELPTITYKS